MKRVYWRPQKISKAALLVIGLVAVGGTLAIERFPSEHHATNKQTKLVAAQLAQQGMIAIRDARLAKGHEFDRRFDPTLSGMVGAAMSPVTSLPGHLDAKQTSVNANFAAVVVQLLGEANVKPGDVVAVGYTGSFPALNVSVCAALEAMGVKPIVIHSAASSQFGANVPDMMWLDMERVLREKGIISFRSHAATLGGFGDRARGMSEESHALLRASLDRNGVSLMRPTSLKQSIRLRMQAYARQAAGQPIKAYINVGGGAASIHGVDGRTAFGAGLADELPDTEADLDDIDCVATRFAADGVPVIHVGNAVELAARYGLPVTPQVAPEVGEGRVYGDTRPSRLLAGLLLVGLLGMIRAYVWSDLWIRFAAYFRGLAGKSPLPAPQAELMV